MLDRACLPVPARGSRPAFRVVKKSAVAAALLVLGSIALFASNKGVPRAGSSGSLRLPLLFVPSEALGRSPNGFILRAEDYGLDLQPNGFVLWSGDVALRAEFEGAAPGARLEGQQLSPSRLNFLYGTDAAQWHWNVTTYLGVRLRSLYPGIDLLYRQDGQRVKSEFLVAPGADPSIIRWNYPDAETVEIDSAGALVVHKAGRTWTEEPPLIYQVLDGRTHPIEGAFHLAGPRSVAFSVDAFDPSLPLVIDPTLTFSTLVGSSGSTYASAMTCDALGMVYVAGYTDGYNFPVQGTGFARAGGVDAIVAKINPKTSQMVYATYIGGWGDDRASGVAVDAAGNILLAGTTTSTNFPTTSAFQNLIHGYKDAFLLKLNPATGALAFSTYYGGTGSETVRGMAVSSSGLIYLAGETDSWDLPSPSGYKRASNGALDAFVARFTTAGQLDAATYFGGGGNDRARSVTVDPSGNVWIGGSTDSLNLPTLSPLQSTLKGSMDGFLAKFDPTLATLLASTYIGGSQGSAGMPEEVLSVTTDSTGALYAGGVTPSADFPLKSPAQSVFGGESDGWVAKIVSTGNSLVFSSFFGGFAYDAVQAVTIDTGGRFHAAGQTYSTNLLTSQPIQAASGGFIDAFLASFDSTTGALTFSTYLGGSGSDSATALAPGWCGRLYIAGTSASTEFPQVKPITAVTGATLRFFLTEFTYPTLGKPQIVSLAPYSGSGTSGVFTARFRHPDGIEALYYIHMLINNPFGGHSACYMAYLQGKNVIQLTSDTESSWPSATIGTNQTLSNSQCTVTAIDASAVESGTDLVLTLKISFTGSFNGLRKVWLHAVDDALKDTGFVEAGSFTVTTPSGLVAPPVESTAPTVASAPSQGSGSGETFTFRYQKLSGATDPDAAYALFNTSATAVQGCLVGWQRGPNLFYLATDSGAGWLPAVRPNSIDYAENSQCVLSGVGTSADATSDTRIVSYTVVFKSPLTGAISQFARATYAGGYDTGYLSTGTYQVSIQHGPQIVSIAPASGAASAQQFLLRFRHPDGISSLYYIHMLINNPFGGRGACYLAYLQGRNLIQLASDNEINWPSATLGASQVLTNTQCSVSAATSYAIESGTELLLQFDLTFKPGFAGQKKVWLHAVDRSGRDTGFVEKGAFQVLTPTN